MHVALEDAAAVPMDSPVDVVDTLALNRELEKLERLDPEQARIVELRFFGGELLVTQGQPPSPKASALEKPCATLKQVPSCLPLSAVWSTSA